MEDTAAAVSKALIIMAKPSFWSGCAGSSDAPLDRRGKSPGGADVAPDHALVINVRKLDRNSPVDDLGFPRAAQPNRAHPPVRPPDLQFLSQGLGLGRPRAERENRCAGARHPRQQSLGL